jgi:hypothetical protein
MKRRSILVVYPDDRKALWYCELCNISSGPIRSRSKSARRKAGRSLNHHLRKSH